MKIKKITQVFERVVFGLYTINKYVDITKYNYEYK